MTQTDIKYVAHFACGSTYKSQKTVYILGDLSLSERVLFKKDKFKKNLCAIKEVLSFKSCYPKYMFHCILKKE